MSATNWGLGRRIAFRFGIIAGALWVFPFPIGTLPKTDWLAKLLAKPWDWLVSWFSTSVLGIAEPASAENGSGDRTYDYVLLLLIVLLAALGTVVWSVLDRRRTAYPRLAAAAHVVLRYVLASAMLGYGFSKIVKGQFPDLLPYTLDERVGDMSPMGLVWTFMGYSRPYTMFAGFAEAIGGALLLWRRTATIGALVVIAVMTNVVMLNFCYDVPVKLYSSELLLVAIVIALPAVRRVLGAMLGYATSEAPPRMRMSVRRERLTLLAKVVMIGSLAVGIYGEFTPETNLNDRVHELWGIWEVDAFVADGVERPASASDVERWQKCIFNPRFLTLWAGTKPTGFALTVDSEHGSIALTSFRDKSVAETWKYTRPTPEQLVIDAVHDGKPLHVTLHRRPDGLLLTRGFHWINEYPYNR